MKKIRKINAEKKLKSKNYYDEKNNVKMSEVKVGDLVLVRRIKKNKLSTTFDTSPVKVIRRSGPTLTMIINGYQTTRNVRDVKKVPHEEENVEDWKKLLKESQEEVVQQDEVEDNTSENTEDESEPEIQAGIEQRPVRERKPPERYQDYIME